MVQVMSHPGLLVDEDTTATPLPALRPLSLVEAAGVAAAVAATLADLHDLGVYLGGFDAEGVVIDGDGRPRLRPDHLAHDDESAARVADVRSIGALLSDLLAVDPRQEPATTSRMWARLHRRGADRQWLGLAATAKRAMAATTSGPRARQVADAIAALVPDARLPQVGTTPADESPTAVSPSHRIRRQWRSSQLAAGVAALVLVVLLIAATHHPTGRPHTRVATAPPTVKTTTVADLGADDCPPVTAALHADVDDDGCDDALDYADGVLSSPAGRFGVGEPGDRAATGRWACAQQATLALLRPDGTIYVADGWAAPGEDVTLRPVGAVAGATDITTVSGSGGCDELVVHKGDGSTTTVRPGRQP